jgi:hypothetical protein
MGFYMKYVYNLSLLLMSLFLLSGCAVVGGIFKAGVWVGVVAVVFVVIIILLLVNRSKK